MKIMRIFDVQTRPGCAAELLGKFASTSAAVVEAEPGNLGYFYGHGVETAENTVMFVSIWADMAAVKARFGVDWQSSYLPPGYDDLIETCSVRHVQVDDGWKVSPD